MRYAPVLASTVLALAVAACGGDEEETASPDAAVPDVACELGAVYSSTAPHECGHGPSGIVYCAWKLRFDTQARTVDWHYSDVSESGSYDCKDGVISARVGSRLIRAQRVAADMLVWDNLDYKPGE